jgi:hypothetical protein
MADPTVSGHQHSKVSELPALATHPQYASCRYLLQPPAPRGSPFIITNKTITELHLALARRAGHYKVSTDTASHVTMKVSLAK